MRNVVITNIKQQQQYQQNPSGAWILTSLFHTFVMHFVTEGDLLIKGKSATPHSSFILVVILETCKRNVLFNVAHVFTALQQQL